MGGGASRFAPQGRRTTKKHTSNKVLAERSSSNTSPAGAGATIPVQGFKVSDGPVSANAISGPQSTHASEMAKVKKVVSSANAKFSFSELLSMLGSSVRVSAELQQLFQELVDEEGFVTKEQFLTGLQATPSVDGSKAISSLLQNCNVLDLLGDQILMVLQRRLGLLKGDIDMETMLQQLKAADIREGLRAAENAIVDAVIKSVDRMQAKNNISASTQQFNDKFAYDNSTFEGVYLDVAEFRNGVQGALGLPGKDIYAGMEMEFCYSGDSKQEFQSSNYGILTTPAEEWEFVVSPDMSKDYSGDVRRPVPLAVLLEACSAKKAINSEERFETPLQELPEDTCDGVKTVLLRRVKEAGLTPSFLAAGAGAEPALERLAQMAPAELNALGKRLGAALRGAPVNAASGHPTFRSVVEAMGGAGGLSEAEAEGLVAAMRAKVREAELDEEEVIALRLYTGPAFRKMNGTLRGLDDGQQGNNYVSTIFAAVSGMAKVAEISPIPAGRTVYRGQKGMRLPASFWKGNAQGVKGGVEMAFLSTTTNFQVASQYAAEGALPTVFAIQVGAVDKGAALGFLSQFAEEDEILMPPRSFLEVVDEPALLAGEDGVVLSIPVKINCNLLCPTLEKLREGRKTMLVSTLEHVRKEIARDVKALVATEEVKQRAKADIFWKYPARRREFLDSIRNESVSLLAVARERPAAWYNTDMYFRRAMHQALDLQRIAMGKLRLWLEERKLYIMHLAPLSALDCDRKAAGRIRRLMEEAEDKAGGGGGGGGKGEGSEAEREELAERLCRHMELTAGEVDEAVETEGGETALMRYAAEGNQGAVRLLLAARADGNLERTDGMTALIIAAQGGHGDVCRLLVQKGKVDVDARDKVEGRTALIHAAENGHTGTVGVLLAECEASPSVVIKSGPQAGGDAAYRAAYFGFLQTLKALVEVGGMDVGAAKDNGWTAAMAAAQNGHVEVLQWVLREGEGRVNMQNGDGKSAVMLAAQQGHEGVVRWLVREGCADAKAVDKRKSTVLMLAVAKGSVGLVEFLVEEGMADVNAADEKGRTALMLAAVAGKEAIVKLLAGACAAEVEVADSEGYTALMLAAEQGHGEVVGWLLGEGGAEAQRMNARRGCTAAMCAAEKGKLEVLQALVAAKAEVNAANAYGTTLLMAAAGEQQREVVAWLLGVPGLEVEAKDCRGWSAAHYAVFVGDAGLAKAVARAAMEGGASEEAAAARVREIEAEVEAGEQAPLQVVKGLPWKAWLDAAQRTVTFTAFTSLRLQASCPSPRRAYYELEILAPLWCPQFGFATASFAPLRKRSGKGVGDDEHSWGLDGDRARRFHSGSHKAYKCSWAPGDVVGLACDLAQLQILVSVNGDFSEPNGVAFELDPAAPVEELFAAFSSTSGSVRYNFGDGGAFKFAPPSSDFVPMVRALTAGL